MGTTPMGLGSTSNSPGNKPKHSKNHHHDEDNLPDPNPIGYVQPPTCSSIMCAPNASGFPTSNVFPSAPNQATSTGLSTASQAMIALGIVLIVGGLLFTGIGAAMIVYGAIELAEVGVGAAVAAEAAQGVAVGIGFYGVVGVGAMDLGYQAVNDGMHGH